MPSQFFAILAVIFPMLPEIGACRPFAANNSASRSRANPEARRAMLRPKKARAAGTKHGKAPAQASSTHFLDFHLGDIDT